MDSTSSLPKFAYVVTADGRLSVTVDSQNFILSPDQVGFSAAIEAIKQGNVEAFLKAASQKAAIVAYSNGNISISGNAVLYKGREVHNALTHRLMDLMQRGLPFEPWIRFFDNLMKNPSYRAIKEVYEWVERHKCPITEDGRILGHKKLQSVSDRLEGEPTDRRIYVDVHSHTIRQWVGKTVEMERNQVDDNWGTACSEGFHVGTPDYHFNGDAATVVAVNPADFVAADTSSKKFRCSRYEILKIVDDRDFTSPLTTSDGTPVESPEPQRSIASAHELPDDDDQDQAEDDQDQNEDQDPNDLHDDDCTVVVTCNNDVSDSQIGILDALFGDTSNEASKHDDVYRGISNTKVVYRSVEEDTATKFKELIENLRFVVEVDTDGNL